MERLAKVVESTSKEVENRMHKVKIIVAGDVDGRKEFEINLTDTEIAAVRKVIAAYNNPLIGTTECENENTGTPYIDLALEVLE